MTNFLDRLTASLPEIVVGVILLIVAFIVATLVKKFVEKLLNNGSVKNKLSTKSTAPGEADKMVSLIGKIVFLLVFILFLPAIFEKLNIAGLSAPFTNFTNAIITFLPKLIAAAVILYIGFFVAKIVRDVVATLLVKVGLDGFVNRFVKTENDSVKVKISDVLANIVYAFIIVPLIIVALDLLGLYVISEPAKNIIQQFLSYVPRIFTALLLVGIGVFIAKLIANLLLSVLQGLNVDGLLSKVGINREFRLSEVISKIVMVVLVVVFVVEALQVLNLAVLTAIGSAIIAYMPLLLSAVIILVGAYLLANLAEKKIVEHNSNNKVIALIVKVLIMAVAVFMTLSQLGLAQNIVEYGFVIVLGAVAVAFALSFGLGGKEFAKDKLAKLDRKLDQDKL